MDKGLRKYISWGIFQG